MPDTITIYKDKAGEWRWRKTAVNGDIRGDSGEGYVNRLDADQAARHEAEGTDAIVEYEGTEPE